jgi:osmoprotectant transport system permease protein
VAADEAGMTHLVLANVLDTFTGAIEFIFEPRESTFAAGGGEVGGLSQVWGLTKEHLKLSGLALGVGLLFAMPIGVVLGHRGRGEGLAIALGNSGRAIPELALIAFFVAYFGTGLLNATVALSVLAIPPILTNAFVGIRQVDRDAIAAARGMGMTEPEVLMRVELPLAAPTIMTGVRTAAVNVIATATIAPLIGVLTLGDFILSPNIYETEGVLAGAILVAVLVIVVEVLLAGLQRLLTPKGVELQRAAAAA